MSRFILIDPKPIVLPPHARPALEQARLADEQRRHEAFFARRVQSVVQSAKRPP